MVPGGYLRLRSLDARRQAEHDVERDRLARLVHDVLEGIGTFLGRFKDDERVEHHTLQPIGTLNGLIAADCRRRLNNHPRVPVEKSPTLVV